MQLSPKDITITFLEENIGFFTKKRGSSCQIGETRKKNERILYLDPALWCGGGRGQLLARKKRRDEERNQVTETNLTWSQLLFKSLTVSDSRSTRRKVPQRLHVRIQSLWQSPPSPTQEAKHARLRQRTQIIYYITGLEGVTQCRWMNVTEKTINNRINSSTRSSQARTRKSNNKKHIRFSNIMKTEELKYHILGHFRKQHMCTS